MTLGYALNLATGQTCKQTQQQLHPSGWDGEITWDRSWLGTSAGEEGSVLDLDLVSPLTPLVRRATTQWDLENRVGMEIGEGPEKAKCASLKTLCGGRWQ